MTAYYIDNTGIYTSDGKIIIKPDIGNGGEVLLTTLLNDHPKDNKLFYDLDACVASLLHLTIGEGAMRELADKEKTYVSGGIKITYFPNRFFALDGRNSFVNFGNMTRYKSDTHYSPIDTIEDKIDKAKEASNMAISASEVLGELGLDKQRIISPVGALIDKFIYSLKPPTVDDYPEEVGKLAYDTIQGNWLEAFKLGSWQKAYDYDINAAYGSILAKLVDTRRGTWVHSNEMPPQAFYGFASGMLTVDAPFHPFIMKQDEEYTYTPVGSRRDTLPKSMIDLLYKYKLGTFEIDNGWWWIPSESKPMYEPLRGIITHLHTIRSESDGLKKAILRQMIAGIWGRMLEIKKDKFGTLFNPVWASIVENEIKCQVCETCLSNGVTPLLVAVDGIITDKPLPIESSLEMGKLRLSHVGKCIIVSSGVVGFEGKQGAEEFALRYEWLQNQLFNNPAESEFSMNKYSPLTLAKAIQTDNLKHLGELQEVNRVINIGKDYKRLWKKYPKCGEDLLNNIYDSVPIDSIMAGGTVATR